MNRATQFRNHFSRYDEIPLKEIYDYFHEQENLNDDNIKVLLSRWTARNILFRVKKGIYKLADKGYVPFRLSSDKLQKQMAELFCEQYPELKYSVWNTGALNRLTTHQHFNSFYVFETDADILESVFYMFKEWNLDVFMLYDGDILQRYMYNVENPIVIKRLVSRSPLVRNDGVLHPALEKVLVDICSDRTLFDFVQGTELGNIYANALRSYVVNITKLLSYADRRKIRPEIESIIMPFVTKGKI